MPAGFCATVFADKVGHARHMVIAPNGAVYVNTWSGRYYGNDTPPSGGMLVALQDTTGDGHADIVKRFGSTFKQGNHGGTSIGLYRDSLYAETNDKIVRYPLPKDGIVPKREPETVVLGLPVTGDHPMHRLPLTRTAIFLSTSPRRRIHANPRTASRRSRARSLAPNSRHEPAFGATTPTRRGKNSRRPSAMRQAFVMLTASPSRRTVLDSTRHSREETSSTRTGRSSTHKSRGPTCLPKSFCT